MKVLFKTRVPFSIFIIMISVIIVEDNADYRKSLQHLFSNAEGFTCRAAYENAEACLQEKAYLQADIALIDIQLPGINGIELVKQVTAHNPQLLCMICTAYEDDEKVFSALEAGAHAYMLKSAGNGEILQAVIDVKNGGSPMSSQVARKVVQSFKRQVTIALHDQLTPRESDVLELLSKGLLYKEIANKLSISIDTVRRHCFNIYDKLHVHNRTEALNKYFRK